MAYEIEEVEVDNEEVVEAEGVEIDLFDDDEIEEKYKEMLDCEGSVTVGGIDFMPSQILEECDPTAYSVGLADAEDSLQETEEKFVCPDCSQQHDDEDEATYCCQERTVTKYQVDGEDYDTREEAQEEVDRLEEEAQEEWEEEERLRNEELDEEEEDRG